jgi:uncharacterized protein YigE (DUF2233 family)
MAKTKRRASIWTGTLVVLCLVMATVQIAQSADTGWLELAPGFSVRRFTVRTPETGMSVELHAISFDPARFELRAVDARAQGVPASTAAELAAASGALAVANASYFLADYTPLGLLVSQHKQLNPIRKADWGVFWVDDSGKSGLTHSRDWNKRRDLEFAVQAGPRLVVDGEVLSMKPHAARRTILCNTRDGRVVLAATAGPVMLSEMATIAARSAAEDGLSCHNALNLDGGSSTQLHVSFPNQTLGVASSAEVPIGVGIFHRSAR